MYFQRINDSDPEKVFIRVKNSMSTDMAVGEVCVFDYTTDADGIGVITPTTALLPAVAGITAAAITAGNYGAAQAYGHNADALVSGGTNVSAGDQLAAKNAVTNLIKAGGTLNDAEKAFFVAGEAFTTSTAAAKKVFVRCL